MTDLRIAEERSVRQVLYDGLTDTVLPFRIGAGWRTLLYYCLDSEELGCALRERDWDEVVRPGSFYGVASALLVAAVGSAGGSAASEGSLTQAGFLAIFAAWLIPFLAVQHIILRRGQDRGPSAATDLADTFALLGTYSYFIGMVALVGIAAQLLFTPSEPPADDLTFGETVVAAAFFFLLYRHIRLILALHRVSLKRIAGAVVSGVLAGLAVLVMIVGVMDAIDPSWLAEDQPTTANAQPGPP